MKFARFARRRRNGRAGAAPQHRTLRAEPLEPRLVLSGGGLLITELMAANSATLVDGDGGTSDWIELHNSTEQSIELGDYFLTDDADDLQKWPFPAVSLAGGDYLVVFASAPEDALGDVIDDYVDAGGSYHTNFQLDRDGEFLALTFADPAAHEKRPI